MRSGFLPHFGNSLIYLFFDLFAGYKIFYIWHADNSPVYSKRTAFIFFPVHSFPEFYAHDGKIAALEQASCWRGSIGFRYGKNSLIPSTADTYPHYTHGYAAVRSSRLRKDGPGQRDHYTEDERYAVQGHSHSSSLFGAGVLYCRHWNQLLSQSQRKHFPEKRVD